MKSWNWNLIHPQVVKILWGFLFISLPVTSFPYFPSAMGGKTMVRPLALYPLLLLVILLTIPRIFKRPLPRTFLPILAFGVIAMISSLVAYSSSFDALLGVTMTSRVVRNLITLGIGLTLYITITLLPETWEDLKFSLRWLYVGLILTLLWSTLQIPYLIIDSSIYFKWVNHVQSFISVRKLFNTRISGLTFEPKWLADQICFLYLPWLLGAVLTKSSIFKWRIRWITVEWLLLGWASFVLIFTYSRSGWFTLAILILASYIIFRFNTQQHAQNTAHRHKRKQRIVLEVALIIFTLVSVGIVVGSQNPYFSRLWRYWTEAKRRNRTYLEFIAFQQRFIYWETAFHTYESYPLLGVGPGNYVFYFDDMLPVQNYHRQKEIMRQITPAEGRNRLITPKNLPAKLLAETGLLGTAAFSTFILAICGCILYLWLSSSPSQKYWGLSGTLAMVVFCIVIFSFDSFALPNMWVVFGLITAAAHLEAPQVTATESASEDNHPAE